MLVKPAGKVLDFRTEVTGATEATMQVSLMPIELMLQPVPTVLAPTMVYMSIISLLTLLATRMGLAACWSGSALS